MGYQEKLFKLRQTGVKYSIEPMQRLAEAIGNPERDLSFVHIAGTNGKGSVAAMAAGIGKAFGLKVGLFTSPHMVSYRERFKINDMMIPEPVLERYLAFFESRGWPGTFFEISAALALLYFHEEKTDLVIWETGLGGRLDATNIVTPRVSVLTSISLDHTQILGCTLSEIAVEKAEIIKPGVSVVTCRQEEPVLAVIRDKASAAGAALKVISDSDLDEFESPLLGDHQRWNTAVAVAAMRVAAPGITNAAIREGLRLVKWPARGQLLPVKPPILLDGAHNPAAMQALIKSLPRFFWNKKFNLIFGAVRDKDLNSMAETLRQVRGIKSIYLIAIPNERGAPVELLKEFFPEGVATGSWREAWQAVQNDDSPVLVTGSFFLAGEVLRYFEQPLMKVDAAELWAAGVGI